MANLLPMMLYNIENKLIDFNSIIKNNCFYFYSYQKFNVEIDSVTESVTTKLYSVNKLINSLGQQYLDIQNSDNFNNYDNFGYTLYVSGNNRIKLKLTSIDGVVYYYEFIVKLDNIIDESNEHYLDLIINHKLPTFEELNLAINSEFSNSELLKRLLLDFKNILKYKGTKTSILKFFNLIGMKKDQLNIFEEYFNDTTNNSTLIPDKTKDYKTGNYHVIYDNQKTNGLDVKNFPNYEFTFEDLTEFKENLINAISLANKYFTSIEQNINFFGISYHSNLQKNLAITSLTSKIFEFDVFNFRKNINIEIFNHEDSENKTNLVKNCVQYKKEIFRSEVKYVELMDYYTLYYDTLLFYGFVFNQGSIVNTPTNIIGTLLPLNPNTLLNVQSANISNPNIFLIETEIFDDYTITQFNNIKRNFGNILHIKISTPNTFLSLEIISIENNDIMVFDKIYVDSPKYFKILLLKKDNYKINIKITDSYNNIETYFYDLNLSENIGKLDFDLFSSCKLIDNNNLSLDLNSSTNINTLSDNYGLPIDLVPFDLANYYMVNVINPVNVQNYTNNAIFKLTEMNKNMKLNDISESIPLKYFNNILDIITFKYDFNYTLKLKIYNDDLGTYELIDYSDINLYDNTFDKVMITLFDVYDRDINGNIDDFLTPYYFITTIEAGITINKTTYDFVLVENNNQSNVISIYDLPELNYKQIDIVNDLPLFYKESLTVPNFNHYISVSQDTIEIEGTIYPLVKSIFSKLISVDSDLNDEINGIYKLKIGDIIVARPNNNYIINENNVTWQIFNSFTNELLFESTDFALKYVVTEKTIFDIKYNFIIDNVNYSLIKKSAFSSYNK